MPALQFQYIVAGIGPVVIASIAIGGGLWFWRWLTNIWLRNLEKGSGPIWKFVRLFFRIVSILILIIFADNLFTALFITFSIFIILLLYKNVFPFKTLSTRSKWIGILIAIAVILMIYWILNQREVVNQYFSHTIFTVENIRTWSSFVLAFTIIFGSSTIFPKWLTKFFRIFYFLVFVGGFVIIGLIFYQENIYSHLPQELGGVKPRCAFLDINTENLSAETRGAMFGTYQTVNDNLVLRSNKLDVLFANSSVMMVRTIHPESRDEDNVYEIPRVNVQAISWCK